MQLILKEAVSFGGRKGVGKLEKNSSLIKGYSF